MALEKNPFWPDLSEAETARREDARLAEIEAARRENARLVEAVSIEGDDDAAQLITNYPFGDDVNPSQAPHDKTEEWDQRAPTGAELAQAIMGISQETVGQGADGGGLRLNAGKNRIELLPEIWLWALADVMTQGSKKYEARNWEKGMDWSTMIGCMHRHLAKFQSGQRYDGSEFDKEKGTTGCHELAMVAWNALALMFYDLYGLGTNDLPEYENLDHFLRVNAATSDLLERISKIIIEETGS